MNRKRGIGTLEGLSRGFFHPGTCFPEGFQQTLLDFRYPRSARRLTGWMRDKKVSCMCTNLVIEDGQSNPESRKSFIKWLTRASVGWNRVT